MMGVFQVSLTFFVLALAGILVDTRNIAGMTGERTRWFSSVCIVLGIASLVL
ncbi:hypothetical protein [Halalkalicoccus subterraneus]|uniref:hypothetical protein n=1 Tax=Halalkalicoccus subterraneus TaxID=2675002 RepID=UPI001FE5EB6C|nr:hypothetical protein [Halalkalicoccus subterraneus]